MDAFLAKVNRINEEYGLDIGRNVNEDFVKTFLSDAKVENIAPEENIAPVAKSTYLQKGGLDGSATGVAKTVGGTVTDVTENSIAGGGSFLEKLWDGLLMLGAAMNQGKMMEAAQNEMIYYTVTGDKEAADTALERYQSDQDEIEKETAKYVAEDTIKEKEIAKAIIDPVEKKVGIDPEGGDSVLGDKSDALVQSGTELLMRQGINKLSSGAGLFVSGASALGGEAENAFRQGATFDEAVLSGMISAGAEMGTEYLFGGIKFGGKTLTEGTANKIASTISNKFLGTLAKWGFNTAGEGFEEVASGYLSAAGQQLTYADKKEIDELFSSEDAWDSFVGGIVLGGLFEGVSVAGANKNNIDYVSGLSKDERAVVDKVYKDAVAKAEKGGRKLTTYQKTKIFDEVVEQVENGHIPTASPADAATTTESSELVEPGTLEWVQEIAELGKSASDSPQTQTGEQAVQSVIDEVLSNNAEQAVDTETQAGYDNKNGQGGTSYARNGEKHAFTTAEDKTGYRDDRRLSVRNELERRTQGGGDGSQSSRVFPEQGFPEGTSGPPVYNQGGRQSGPEINRDFDGFAHYSGDIAIDNEGKSISQDNVTRLKGTTVLDVESRPVAVYHGTPDMEFTSFEKGDTGIHLGTIDQAKKRIGDKQSTRGRLFRGYAVIRNPIFSEIDIGRWDAEPFSMFLVSKGIISAEEYQEVQDLLTGDREYDKSYDAPSAVRLRDILENKGYDGVAYLNFFEGDDLSYMIFRDDQFIRTGISEYNADNDGNSAGASATNINAATTAANESVGAAPAGYAENTVGGAQSQFEHKQKTSAIYANTYANTTDEDVRKVGEESKAADPNIDKYDVVTEKESLHNAEQRTRSEDEIAFEYEDLIHKSGWTGEDNDTAMFVLNHLRKTGDTEKLRTLARKQREEGTRGAQLTQSFAKYTRMTATDCVLESVEAIDDLTPKDVAKRHYKGKVFEAWKQELTTSVVNIANEIDAVEDGDTESLKDIIRSLAKFRKTTAWFGTSSNLTKIAEGALKDIDFDTAKAIANAQLSTLPNDFVKRPAGQIVKTIRIHNMLASLTTFGRNLSGNATIGIVDAISDSTVGQAIDTLVAKATGKRSVGADITQAKVYFKGAAEATKIAALCTELDIPMDSESRFSTGSTRTFSPQGGPVTRFLSVFDKYMRYSLEVSDQFFEGGTNAAVEKSLENLGSKTNLTPKETAKIAKLVGERRTFKDDRALRRVSVDSKNALNEFGGNEFGLGDMVLPFAGTGSNVTQVGVDYTTLGVGGLIDVFRLISDVKHGKYVDGVKTYKKNGKERKISLAEAQRSAVTNAGRGITGLGLVATFAAMAAAGILKVHDDKDEDKRGLEQSMNLTGAQINVDAAIRGLENGDVEWKEDDYVFSMDFLEPFNAQMRLGYLLAQEDSVQDMVNSYGKNAFLSIAQSILDMPMMQGLAETLETAEGAYNAVSNGEDEAAAWANAGGQALGSTASGFIPATLRQAAQVIDPYYRDTTGENAGEKAINQILAQIPLASQTLPKKYSGLGQEQRRYEDLSSGIFNTFVNPGELEQIKSSEVADYLDELSERTGDVTFYPAYVAPGSFKMDGKKVIINGKEDTEAYQKTYGTNVNRLYGQLIKNADFLEASDELQVEILNSAKDYATQLAKAKVSDYAEVPSYIKNRAAGMSEAEAILRHVLLTKANGDAATKNTEYYSYLSVDDASWLVDMISRITPEKNGGEVRPIQKIEAVAKADSKLSAKEQQQVLEDILSDSLYAKYLEVLDLGMDTDDFAASYRLYLDTTGKEKKARTIKKYQNELGISYAAAKKLYEIYG